MPTSAIVLPDISAKTSNKKKKKDKKKMVPESVVIAVGMIGSNYDLEQRDRETALKLLATWDDGSYEFKKLVHKGKDYVLS